MFQRPAQDNQLLARGEAHGDTITRGVGGVAKVFHRERDKGLVGFRGS